jgi:murein DD-endopeptidase MepM/ murein hydrolase activator NlpD
MTSGYGYRSCDGCSADHRGIDLTPGSGYPVKSVADGVVVLAEESDSGLGVQVVVEHVIDGVAVRTVYAHLQYGSLAVSTGDTVARGQQLGVVGSTGASTGPHLHFEVLIAEEQIDPLAWLIAHANS